MLLRQTRQPIPVLILLTLMAAGAAGAGTVLNTLQGYDNGEEGWSGGLDGLYSGSGGNTERIIFSAGGRVQNRVGPDRWRLQVSGSYEESNNQVTARNGVAHLRQNHEFAEHWATIAFTQVQANPFQRLKSRYLVGAGLRRDLVNNKQGDLAVGAVPMLEITRLDGEDSHTARGRLSVFLYIDKKISDTTRLDAVVFWQPLFSDLSSSRTVANVALAVEVTGEVDLKLGAAVEDNAEAPEGVERTDWSTFAGFGIDF